MKKRTALVEIAARLAAQVSTLRFGAPVTHVYNPLTYAWSSHRRYLERYGTGKREVLLVGMNPGPWGMAQTGVPFGEVILVRDWLKIETPVGRPEPEHPRRPVRGFSCPRREVSGTRLWGWAKHTFKTPERFFSRFFVANYCPLCFLEAGGRNRTPDKLPRQERQPLLEACDAALRETVEVLGPRCVIGVGHFAERSARRALAGCAITVGRIPHPSPASPAANRNWAQMTVRALDQLGIGI
ncbi:MAG: single-stranded DNA-binding protein [Candidatus Hydrogenedentes bacterium]|nr:single-stranded DNA-binding protein [Candidatus Hydrogenedentota bacterium]